MSRVIASPQPQPGHWRDRGAAIAQGRLARVLGALVVALALAVPASVASLATPTAVAAAAPDLTITSTAHYDVQPEKRRVRVVVDLVLTNHLKDTKTKRYYFHDAYLDVMPHTAGFRLTSTGNGSPSVVATRRAKTYTRLHLRYPNLYSGKTARYRLSFDIRDPGGSPTRDLRIGDSLVSFPVWAFATDSTPGGSVRVTFPKGFQVDVEAGSIEGPTTDTAGNTVFDSGRLQQPLSFFAYLVADRPGAYRETSIHPTVEGSAADVVVRSWPDDRPWGKRVEGLLTKGLPALGKRIGLPWAHAGPLTVQEAVSRSTEGYAGLFDPGQRLVEVAYYADDFVVLHEAAHAWFNGALLADRWANEAFASYYAAVAAADLHQKVKTDAAPDPSSPDRIALNAWGPVGRTEAGKEDYAYRAGLALAREIAKRAGDDGLRAVWDDAVGGVGAYQPPVGPAERVDGPPDWRGMLDLLEARTGATYDDLWRTWVARPTDVPLLAARAAARTRYDGVVAQAGDWQLPRSVRDAMRNWRFDEATALLTGASAVLAARSRVDGAVRAAGLTAPGTLRQAFEDDDGFDDATAEAAAELETVRRYQEAVALRPTTSDPIRDLGLWGETPDASLLAARTAFASGDLEASAADAAAAAATWSHAGAVGQGRAFSLGLLALAAMLAVLLLIAGLRRRRRHRWQARPMHH